MPSTTKQTGAQLTQQTLEFVPFTNKSESLGTRFVEGCARSDILGPSLRLVRFVKAFETNSRTTQTKT